MTRSAVLSLALGALALTAACRPPGPRWRPARRCSIAQLNWLSGCWRSETPTRVSLECWAAAEHGNHLVGTGSSGPSAHQRTFSEKLEIRHAPNTVEIQYVAQPQGQGSTAFALTRCAPRRVQFDNPRHDFPQRITYWLDAKGELHAQIAGPRQGRWVSRSWVFRRAPVRKRPTR